MLHTARHITWIIGVVHLTCCIPAFGASTDERAPTATAAVGTGFTNATNGFACDGAVAFANGAITATEDPRLPAGHG